jgi:hypothetical protein
MMVRGTRNIEDLVGTTDGWKIRRRVHPAVWASDVQGTPLEEFAATVHEEC